MSDLIFDTPYWLLGLLVLGAVGIWFAGNARQEKRLQLAAGAILALAVLLAVLSKLVDTDKEKVSKQTTAFVAAVEKKDKAAMSRLLHPRANFIFMGKDQIVEKAAAVIDEQRVTGIGVSGLDVVQLRDEITATFNASADIDSPGYKGGAPSTWQFVWERTAQGWLLRDIKPLKMPGGLDIKDIVGRAMR